MFAGPSQAKFNLIEHLKKSTDEFTLTAKIAMINLVLDGCFKFNPQGVQKVKVQMTPCFSVSPLPPKVKLMAVVG